MRCELNQISLVQFVKARGIRTVDIQNADDAPLMVKRNDDLASGCAVAGDMAGKGVHIGDALNLVALGGRAAYAAPQRNLCAGGQAAEWPECQHAAIQQIKAAPVDPRQSVGQKRGHVRQIGDGVEGFIQQGRGLRQNQLIARRRILGITGLGKRHGGCSSFKAKRKEARDAPPSV